MRASKYFCLVMLMSLVIAAQAPGQTSSANVTCDHPGAFALTAPTNGATAVSRTVTLSWAAATGADHYIVHLGTTNPPSNQNDRLVIGTHFDLATSTLGPLAAGSTYYWSVDAVAGCDASIKTLNTGGPQTFTVSPQCDDPGAFALAAPANGNTGVSPTATLSWGASSGADHYILHIGTTNPPSSSNDQTVSGTSFTPASSTLGPLLVGTTYYWSVEAVAACNATSTMINTGGLHSFTVTETVNVWVPVAIHADGLDNSHWRTDVGILNGGAAEASIQIRYYMGGAVMTMSTQLAAGAQTILTDIVAQVGSSGSGALEIRSDQPVMVTSRTYNLLSSTEACYPNGTLGQDYPSFIPSDGLSSGEVAYLPGLTENVAYRCNIGLVNAGTGAATVLVELFDGSGAKLAEYTVTLDPGEWSQTTRPFATKAGQTNLVRGYAKLTVVSGSGVLGFASVIDNITNDPTTVTIMR